ncbi:MAG: 30S ribosomal protein S12 methylthiotransferase RimO [Desulfitobacteriia bacterium]
MKKVAVVNLGCPKNQVDSEVITGLLAKKYKIVSEPEEANIIIVNTCGFIEEAKQESIEVILEMTSLKGRTCEKVYAVGCLAQRYSRELLEEIPELDGVLGDGDLDKIPSVLETTSKVHSLKKCQDFIYSHEMPRIRFGPPYFAYVKIAEGCNNRCSYCAIPSIKGRYRSRTIPSVVEEVKKLAREGVKEIALVAQDTTRYGIDLGEGTNLVLLLKELVKVEGLAWIRLMYCYPDAFTSDLIELIAQEPKICKYVDLPLQHADNEILKKMNRRNTSEEAEDLIKRLRREIPGIFIRSTFITGFPGETETQFQKLVDFIKNNKLDRLGVFAYSREEGTPAAEFTCQIPSAVREQRKKTLLDRQYEVALETQQKRVGSVVRVILEEKIADFYWLGRTEGDAPEIDGQIYTRVHRQHVPGDILRVRILEADSYDFKGEGLQ